MRGWDSGGADLSTSCRSWAQWRLSAAGAPADDAGGGWGRGLGCERRRGGDGREGAAPTLLPFFGLSNGSSIVVYLQGTGHLQL
jgi:hypothetical protein